MVVCELKRKGMFRALLVAGLACHMSRAVCGTPGAVALSCPHDAAITPAWHWPGPDHDAYLQTINLRGLAVLAPAQAFPVPPVSTVPAALIEAGQPETYAVNGAPALARAYSFDLQSTDLWPRGNVAWDNPITYADGAWFSPLRSQTRATDTERSGVYRKAVGPSLVLGHITSNAPAWGSTAALGGLQLANWSEPVGSALPAGKLRYSSVLGRLSSPDLSSTSTGLLFGPAAGSGSVRYGLTSRLTLEGQVQKAPSLNTLGWGTTYSAGAMGTFQAGAMQSSFEEVGARRYLFGYTVDINEVKLGYALEQIGAGFGDLSSYGSGGTRNRQIRNAFSAGVPVGRTSLFSGTYTELREASIRAQQRFGFEQSVKLAHEVRFALGADRDVVTGDLGMRANFSIPVNAFMQGHGWHR